MMEKYYELSEDERALIKVKLKEGLMKMPQLTVAYLHGSFIRTGRFRDIDIASTLKIPLILHWTWSFSLRPDLVKPYITLLM